MNKCSFFEDEINYIKNEKYKDNLKKLIELLPDYFFEIPASSTGKYHPSFSLGKGGLVRHTKTAVLIGHEILETKTIGDTFTSDEKDLILISLLIHDGLKSGLTHEKYTRFDHPLLIAEYVRANKDKLSFTDKEIDFICDNVQSHMGEWNTSTYSDAVLPLPKNKYQKFVHMCDFLASRKFLDVKFDEKNKVKK